MMTSKYALFSAETVEASFNFENHTRNKNLLVSLLNLTFVESVLRPVTNFRFGRGVYHRKTRKVQDYGA